MTSSIDVNRGAKRAAAKGTSSFRRASSGELNIGANIGRGPCSTQLALEPVLDTRTAAEIALLACSAGGQVQNRR
jgi:hypothetical protein